MAEIETRDESNAVQMASDALDRHLDSYDRELFRAGWLPGRDWQREQPTAPVEHSEAPWRFDPAPSDVGSDALRGHILPHGAGEDDPAVAWIENVGATDLSVILAGPDMLAVLESVYVDLVDYSKRLEGAYSTGSIALGSCADQVHAVIRKARGA